MKGPIINGEAYSLVLLKVKTRDSNNRPLEVEVGYDDAVYHLEGGEEFLTAFVKTDVIQPTGVS